MKPFLAPFVAAFLAVIASPVAPALAQDSAETARLEQRAGDIVDAMRGDAEYDAIFAEGFVNAVPEAQFTAIQGQIEAQFGSLVGVDTVSALSSTTANIAIRFERGLASGTFAIEGAAPYKVTGFRLSDIRPLDDSVEALSAEITALPGDTGFLIAELAPQGRVLAAHNAAQPFAIGSTFKLYVLSALARAVDAGEHRWDDVVPLDVRSFPSGQLQDWPQGAPVTLHTLATLMISNSDNTATDQLMSVLGRDAIEAEVIASGHSDPASTFPFLTTREMFVLKSGEDIDLDAYASGDVEARLTVLDRIAMEERNEADIIAAFTGAPNAIDIEWFASPHDIAAILGRLAALGDRTALDIMGVNPSMSEDARQDWQYAGYKGGSEPGVLNLTWLLRDADERDWAVTLSWNNAESALDQQSFELLAMRAIALAAQSASAD